MHSVRWSSHGQMGCRVAIAIAAPFILLACGGSTEAGIDSGNGPASSWGPDASTVAHADASASRDGAPDPAQGDAAVSPPPSPGDDASTPPVSDASAPPANDASVPPSSGDGPPTRRACTSAFGGGLSTSHGRLDGYVVAVIPPGQGKQCNGDSSHVHLQVMMAGEVYDVAANVDGNEMERDGALVGDGWSEGWHTQASLDYVKDLSVHSTQFTLTGISTVAAEIEQRLSQANHISIFCTGYDATGCHLVHRQQAGHDGAIVLDPLASTPHWLLFDFATPTF